MATATLRKRLALTVVTALGAGLLAAAPAQAAINVDANDWVFADTAQELTTGTITSKTNADGVEYVAISQVSGAANYVKIPRKSTVDALSGAASTFATVTSTNSNAVLTPAEITYSQTGVATQNVQSTHYLNASKIPAPNGFDNTATATVVTDAYITVPVTAAGVNTVTVWKSVDTNGVVTLTKLQVYTITGTGGAAYGYTTVQTAAGNYTGGNFTNGTGAVKGTDLAVYAPYADYSDAVATIEVAQFDTTNVAASATVTKAVTASIAGVGSLAGTANGTTSTQFITVPAGSASTQYFHVYADGRQGTGTVTISVDGKAAATLVVKFYGKAASVTTTLLYAIGKAGGGTTGVIDHAAGTATANNDPALAVVVKDASGTIIPSATVTAVSSNALVVQGATYGFTDSGSGAYTKGMFLQHWTYATSASATSGQTANLTFTTTNADGTTVSSTPVAIKIGGTTIKTLTAAFDKADYAPGTKAVLTFTAKDDKDNLVADGTYSVLAAGTDLSSSAPVSGLPTGSSFKFVNGVYTATMYVPVIGVNFTVNGTYGGASSAMDATLQGKTLTVAGKVTADTTQTDLLKAQIASLQSALDTLQKSTNTLIANMAAQIKVMNALVKKLTAKKRR